MTRRLVALLLALSATTVSAEVIWRGDFETGDTKQWKGAPKDGVKVVTEPVREGKYALRIDGTNAARRGKLDRIEFQHQPKPPGTAEGTERYFGWSVYLPKKLTDAHHALGYFETRNSWSQVMAFEVKGEDILFTTRVPYKQQWRGKGKMTAGKWHDFALHVLWSRDAEKGFVEVWFDGEKVVPLTKTATLKDENVVFFQLGLLRETSEVPETILIDHVTEATTLEDLTPRPPEKLATGPAKGTDKQQVPPKKSFKVEGHAAFVIMPKNVDEKKPVPWVWYAPTFPNLPEAREHWMFEKFLAAGIAIAGVDVGESYGSPKGREIYSALYKELVTNRNFAPKPVLLARSRGGLMLYNWAAENADHVAGIAGIYPVCDLRSYPGLDKACGAYGLTRAELEEQLDKHNPVARLAPLAKAGVPIFHIHGDADAVVPLKDNSGEVARRYEKLGGKMELKVAKGQGHNLWEGFFQCQELVDFVLARSTLAKEPK